MKMNLTKIMLWTILMYSTTMVISSNNLLFSWMNMEINLIAFLPILSKNKKVTDQIMKYLIIQSTSSLIMLMSIIMNNILETPLEMNLALMISMMLKLGFMPLHLWMPNLMNNISFQNCILMMTVQKIIPITLTTQLLSMKIMIVPMMITMLISPMVGMTQTSVKKIMAYSSISNSPWMLISMEMSKIQFIYFITIYSVTNFMIMESMKINNILYLNQIKMIKKEQKLLLVLMMLSISGMPPLLGFYPKWMIVQMMMTKSILISSLMILSSMTSTYMYMKLIIPMMTLNLMKKNKPSKMFMFKIISLTTMGIPMMMILKF